MLGRLAAVIGIGIGTLLATVTFIGSPATAAAKPQVTITSGPTVNADNSVALAYRINRPSKSIASRECTADTATTSTSVGCGSLPVAKKSPIIVNVTLPRLADGTYTFTAQVTLSNGGQAVTTSTPFTIQSGPAPVADQQNPVVTLDWKGSKQNHGATAPPSWSPMAQTFTAGRTGSLTQITLYGSRREAGTGPLLVDIYATSGGLPTGPSLSTATYTGNGSDFGFDIPLSQSVSLTQGVQYAIAWQPDCDDYPAVYSQWAFEEGASLYQSGGIAFYAGGRALCHGCLGPGSPWAPLSVGFTSFAFKTWMTD